MNTKLTLLFIVILGISSIKSTTTSTRPNIIFILADDLGYGDVSIYPNPLGVGGRVATPNINQLAKEGTQWLQVYANAVCSPSRCSLLTGFHSGHATIRGNGDIPLYLNDTTFATLLQNSNYSTAWIGKWGLGDNGTTGAPWLHGFDYFFGFTHQIDAHEYCPPYVWENDQLYQIPQNYNNQTAIYTHDLFTNQTLTYIQQHAQDTNPFFLMVGYTLPHAGDFSTTDEVGMPILSQGAFINQTWPDVEKNYSAMITKMDNDIGTIYNLVKSLGIDNDTLIIFASDNGATNEGNHDYTFFQSSGYLNMYKRNVYDGGIRVPFIARWPGHVPVRVDNSSIWGFWDLFPTFTQLAGINNALIPQNLDGVSRLSNLLGTQTTVVAPFIYVEFCCRGNFRRGIRMGDWKGVQMTQSSAMQLFNITADIGEQNNIAHLHQNIVTQLTTTMIQQHTESVLYPSLPCNPTQC